MAMPTTPLAQLQEQLLQVQTALDEAYDAARDRVEEAAGQVREGAAVTAELAVRLAYAGIGAAAVAQEQISRTVADLVNAR